MTKNIWILAIVIALAVVVAAAWFLRRGAETPPAVSLLDQFDTVVKKPAGAQFTVKTVTINGDSRKGVALSSATRLTWKVTLPNDAWLRTAIALEPEAWTKEGDGVLFWIGVSDGRTYEPLFKQSLNPFGVPGDRRWVPISIDLSAYGGRQVDIIFNTYAGLPGGANDSRNDLAFWAAPAVYLRP
jgi:hypothetical protein